MTHKPRYDAAGRWVPQNHCPVFAARRKELGSWGKRETVDRAVMAPQDRRRGVSATRREVIPGETPQIFDARLRPVPIEQVSRPVDIAVVPRHPGPHHVGRVQVPAERRFALQYSVAFAQGCPALLDGFPVSAGNQQNTRHRDDRDESENNCGRPDRGQMPVRPFIGPHHHRCPLGLNRPVRLESPQIVGQLLGRGVAFLRLFREGLEDDRLQVDGDGLVQLPRGRRFFLQDLA